MLILHIPHASTVIPAFVRDQFPVADAELADELLHMTDHATDELFGGIDAPRVVHEVSRLVVDPERFSEDADEPMSRRGMGAIYTHGYRGTRIRRELQPAEREDLLARFYEPHHAGLEALVDAALAEEGRCTIVDCHSFASAPLPYEPDREPARPAICLGTDPFHTPPDLVTRARSFLRDRGYEVAIDRPYGGSMVPRSRYRSDPRVRSIMVEVRRDLYVDEATGAPAQGFAGVQADVGELGGVMGEG